MPQTYPNLPYAGLSKWAYNIQLLYSRGKVNFRLAYNWRDKALLSTNVNPLSYATSGGNPYTLNTSPTNFDSDAFLSGVQHGSGVDCGGRLPGSGSLTTR